MEAAASVGTAGGARKEDAAQKAVEEPAAERAVAAEAAEGAVALHSRCCALPRSAASLCFCCTLHSADALCCALLQPRCCCCYLAATHRRHSLETAQQHQISHSCSLLQYGSRYTASRSHTGSLWSGSLARCLKLSLFSDSLTCCLTLSHTGTLPCPLSHAV